MTHPSQQPEHSRWPHRFALLLVACTVALVFVGGLVTTTESGMAVPDWPTTFGYGMFSFPVGRWLGSGWPLFIEHGHRLLGSTVGIITILYVLMLFKCDRRCWMWALGVLTLAAVIFQGVLGGTRVIENERILAMVHGCFAPIFLGMCVSNAVFTSRRWHLAFATKSGSNGLSRSPLAGPRDSIALALGNGFVFAAATLTLLAYAQIVLGAQLRHLPATASAQAGLNFAIFHVATAVALVLMSIGVGIAARRRFRQQDLEAIAQQQPNTGVRKSSHWIGMLVSFQVFLGCATWVLNYGWPTWVVENATSTIVAQGFWQTLLTTAHQTTGSLILATCVALTWRAYAANHRRLQAATAGVAAGTRRTAKASKDGQPVLRPAVVGGAS